MDFKDYEDEGNDRLSSRRRAVLVESNPFFGGEPEAPQPVPDEVLRILACSANPARDFSKLFPVVTEGLTPENYTEKQRLLLVLEEFERSSWRNITMHRFSTGPQGTLQDSEGTQLTKGPDLFAVARPSGQEVTFRSTALKANQPCKCYCLSVCLSGKIVATSSSDILIKLDADVEHTEVLEDVIIYFQKRTPLFRSMYQALEKYPARLGRAGFPDLKSTSKFPQIYASFIEQPDVDLAAEEKVWRDAAELLDKNFSTKKRSKRDRAAVPQLSLRLYNKQLNYRQKCAVEEVVLGVHRPGPYIIFGPPGTGKTMTLVEVVIQLILKCPTSRIVVSAPTDSAVDVLLHFLMASNEADVVWRSGGWVKLVDGTQRSSHLDLSTFTRSVAVPNIFERIVFLTCRTAGRIPEYHKVVFDKFTHVIVDEAGSTIEPEVMLPILLLHIRGDMQIIVAGDVYQMRPYVTSHLACQFGLEISLLSRLLSRPPYQRSTANLEVDDYFDRRNITSLVHQYRSSPKILEVSNKVFYDNKLIFRVPDTTNYCGLPPVVFCSVDGCEMIDSTGSKCNFEEADVVMKYIRKIHSLGFPAKDIAVISAYQAQVQQVQQRLSESRITGNCLPIVRTIDHFLGCESRVVIITAVQTNDPWYSSGPVDSQEGFIGSPDRLNVALSRALDHVCIVGNADHLSQDLLFAELIKYCASLSTLFDVTQLLSF